MNSHVWSMEEIMKQKSVLPAPNFELLKSHEYVAVRRDKDGFPTLNREIKENFKPSMPWPTNDRRWKVEWNNHHMRVFRGLLAAYNEYYMRIRDLSMKKDMDVRAAAREMEKIFAEINKLQSEAELSLQLNNQIERSEDANHRFLKLRKEDWDKTTKFYEGLYQDRLENRIKKHETFMDEAMASHRYALVQSLIVDPQAIKKKA